MVQSIQARLSVPLTQPCHLCLYTYRTHRTGEAEAATLCPNITCSNIVRILIKGGEVVNEDGRQKADVYIEDKKIKQVGLHLEVPGGARIIDATGRLVIPGGIDTHTHCQMPFMGTYAVDDFYIGTKARYIKIIYRILI